MTGLFWLSQWEELWPHVKIPFLISSPPCLSITLVTACRGVSLCTWTRVRLFCCVLNGHVTCYAWVQKKINHVVSCKRQDAVQNLHSSFPLQSCSAASSHFSLSLFILTVRHHILDFHEPFALMFWYWWKSSPRCWSRWRSQRNHTDDDLNLCSSADYLTKHKNIKHNRMTILLRLWVHMCDCLHDCV